MKGYVIVLLALLMKLPSGSSQNSNTHSAYLKYSASLSESWIVAEKHFDYDGNSLKNISKVGYYATNVSIDYFFNKGASFSFSWPVVNYAYSLLPASGQKKSFVKTGDIDLVFHKSLIAKYPFYFCAKMGVGIPTGFTGDDVIQMGDGEFNQLLGFEVRHQLFFADIAINNRTNGFHEEIQWRTGLTLKLVPDKVYASLTTSGIISLAGNKELLIPNPYSFYSDGREWWKITPALQFLTSDKMALHLSMDILLAGRNYPNAPSFVAGVIFRKYLPMDE